MKRPTSVTVIGILIVLFAVFAAVGAVAMIAMKDDPNMAAALAASPLSLETLMLVNGLGAVVMLASGIGVLMGANWARWLFVAYNLFGIAFGLYTSPSPLQVLPSVAILAIFAFFLFRGQANDYFNRAGS